MLKIKDFLKSAAALDGPPTPIPPAPQAAAAAIVKQVTNEGAPRPAAPAPSQRQANRGEDPSVLKGDVDPFLAGGQAGNRQIPDGPPAGYQYDPGDFVEQFEPQQNPIAAAVEQAAVVQPTQGDDRYAQVLAASKTGKPISPADQDYLMDNIREGDYQALDPSPQVAAAQIVQNVQSQNSPDGKRIVMASQSPNDWVLNDVSPGPTVQRPQPRSRDQWVLNDDNPGPTPSKEWVLEPDLLAPAAAARVIQDMQSENSPQDKASDETLGGEGTAADRAADVIRGVASGGNPGPNQSYNAGAGGGGGAPPPGRPTTFSIPEPDDSGGAKGPRVAGEALSPGLWNHLANGFLAQAGDGAYSDSVIGDAFRGRKFPEAENSGFADKAAFQVGRIGADIQGYGTRKGFWNMNPEDAIGTGFREIATNQGLTAPQAQLSRYAAATTLGLVGGNYNPLNIAEGGRTEGFSAVNPSEEDPRKSTNAIGEFVFDRAMLGRTGRVLPWEQFHEERPEVPYQTYADYQDYLRAPAFMGLVKGTMDGIDGPEARVVGSRVQPEAVLAALAAGAAVVGGFAHKNRKV